MNDDVKSEEHEEQPDPHGLGPFLSPGGTVLVMPHALGSGPPQPEPDERWTLGPEWHEEASTEAAETETPLQPVRESIRRSR